MMSGSSFRYYVLFSLVLSSLTLAYRQSATIPSVYTSTKRSTPWLSNARFTRRNQALQALPPNPFTDALFQDQLPQVTKSMHDLSFHAWYLAEEVLPAYAKVDKTGFIGFFATYIEVAIDFGKSIFSTVGIEQGYGISIILFTMLIKALTLPLTKAQLESTTRIQKLTPLQQKIQAKFANDEQTKNQLLAQLFQAAKVNPLAGCFPALVQLPVFLSLYRALTNLVAASKLHEGFLWIPSLEGPVFSSTQKEGMNWLYSAFSGNPSLGWHDTIAYLSLPIILFISQTISQKLLQPPKDPNRKMTEQEQISQGLINNLPIIIAFFSINVPAGLSVYWIVNNVLTTVITTLIKSTITDEPFPIEVDQIMAFVDAPAGAKGGKTVSSSAQEFKKISVVDDRPKPEGFSMNSSAKKMAQDDSNNDGSKDEDDDDNDNDDDEDNDDEEEDSAVTKDDSTNSKSSKKRANKRSRAMSNKAKRNKRN